MCFLNINKNWATLITSFLLKPEKTVFAKLANIVLFSAINVIWFFVAYHILALVNGWPFPYSASPYHRYDIQTLFYVLIMAPIWEELAFRVAPLKIAKIIGKKALWPTIILSSIIFGLGHGRGVDSLLFQGVGGMLMCFLYLKNGYSYWSSVALHFLWNLFAITLL